MVSGDYNDLGSAGRDKSRAIPVTAIASLATNFQTTKDTHRLYRLFVALRINALIPLLPSDLT